MVRRFDGATVRGATVRGATVRGATVRGAGCDGARCDGAAQPARKCRCRNCRRSGGCGVKFLLSSKQTLRETGRFRAAIGMHNKWRWLAPVAFKILCAGSSHASSKSRFIGFVRRRRSSEISSSTTSCVMRQRHRHGISLKASRDARTQISHVFWTSHGHHWLNPRTTSSTQSIAAIWGKMNSGR